jgi:hypothetical protein
MEERERDRETDRNNEYVEKRRTELGETGDYVGLCGIKNVPVLFGC